MSLSDFVQCDVHRSDAYKNQTDNLAKSVGQQKLHQFWLFHVNDPLKPFSIYHRYLQIKIPLSGGPMCRSKKSKVDECMTDTQVAFKFEPCQPDPASDYRRGQYNGYPESWRLN